MSAEATTTPSASTVASRASAGFEMPKPMMTGRSVTRFMRRASTVDVPASAVRSPGDARAR